MRSLPITVVALMLVLAAGRGALAQSPDGAKAEAKKYFEAGVSLLKSEDYEGAATSFEASLEAFPTKTALFNLANCYKALKRYDEALAALFRLRRDFKGNLGGEIEDETTAIEKEIRNLVGMLRVEVDLPGATVLVDERGMGMSPLSKVLLLSPGNHEVTARLEGVEFGMEKVKMLPGKEQVVRLTAKKQATAHSNPTEPSPTQSSDDGVGSGLHQGWFWGSLAATAVLGGATIGVTAAVKKDIDGVSDQDEKGRVEGMQAGGIVLMALTGAAAITTAVLALFTNWGDDEAEDTAGGAAWLTEDGGGIGITGRF
jgi:hypothetical protein